MTDTPETDDCVKTNKHLRFLEENHWSESGKFTYTNPIVNLCKKMERERDEERALADRLALALKMTRWDSPVTCKKAFDAWKERRN